ncbi:MAG: hypothetical protein A3J63_03985 [Candidatus Moranbacteria bacterium RIFCSPHIGHO2_02_FULL_40_12b]|nr:MAG: hypothetical protein A3J63_03985 [Candidatus Moranbacteria bacterium RIFCSPHIGHO2_02_FULL_40_12b]
MPRDDEVILTWTGKSKIFRFNKNMNDDKINYDEILEKYPWLLAENQNAIISPDADGMLCGLFMSHFLGWKIVGHYDNGKNLILKKGMSANECVFLDSEIYRSNIKSIGHHISLFRQNNTNISHEKYRVELQKRGLDI